MGQLLNLIGDSIETADQKNTVFLRGMAMFFFLYVQIQA